MGMNESLGYFFTSMRHAVEVVIVQRHSRLDPKFPKRQ